MLCYHVNNKGAGDQLLLRNYAFMKGFLFLNRLKEVDGLICGVLFYLREAKEVVKAVKKRLQHKNPKVHLLALTVLFLRNLLLPCTWHIHFYFIQLGKPRLDCLILWPHHLCRIYRFLYILGWESRALVLLIHLFVAFLQLLETMVKNCGDNVHFQIAERNILQDMTKIVKKKVSFPLRWLDIGSAEGFWWSLIH